MDIEIADRDEIQQIFFLIEIDDHIDFFLLGQAQQALSARPLAGKHQQYFIAVSRFGDGFYQDVLSLFDRKSSGH